MNRKSGPGQKNPTTVSSLPAVYDTRSVASPLLQYIQFSEFKRLLDQIATTLDREGYKSLAVLSEFPGEGKTFFVSVLALGYSTLLNKRVLIINTGNQTQSNTLHLETVYRAHAKTFPGLKNNNTTDPTIDVVSPHAGNENEEFESSDFQVGQYIRAARDSYHLILSDTCALSITNRKNVDPVVIARHSDSSILITSQRSLHRPEIASIKNRLAHWKIPLMGVIHNTWTGQ